MTTGPDVHKANRQALGRMLAPDCGQSRTWRPEELEAIYRHQMSAPIQFDLRGLDSRDADTLSALASCEGLLLQSFACLFAHPNPPLELLVMTKEFAEERAADPERLLPREVAELLYYTSIVVALTRCGERITSLDDAGLRTGIDWALEQPWVDEDIKTILREGRVLLETREGLAP